jgi:hypothetical protein
MSPRAPLAGTFPTLLGLKNAKDERDEGHRGPGITPGGPLPESMIPSRSSRPRRLFSASRPPRGRARPCFFPALQALRPGPAGLDVLSACGHLPSAIPRGHGVNGNNCPRAAFLKRGTARPEREGESGETLRTLRTTTGQGVPVSGWGLLTTGRGSRPLGAGSRHALVHASDVRTTSQLPAVGSDFRRRCTGATKEGDEPCGDAQ